MKLKQKQRACAAAEQLEQRRLFSLNVLTHDVNALNNGADTAETVLTPANVNAADFGKQFTASVDGGDVIAQPLYLQNVNITTGASAGVHSVVFVATEADGLYALDANTGVTLWHDNFTSITDPTSLIPTAGVTTILKADINNNPDVGVQLGILSTPAIDAGTGIIYLNANTKEIRADGKHFVQRLWAVSIHDGSIPIAPAIIGDTLAPDGLSTTGPYTYVSGPIINGTGNNNPAGHTTPVYPDTDGWTAAPGGATGYVLAFNAIEQMQRTAMSLINGTVYLGFASHGDDGPYYGWVLGYRASDLSLDAVFNTCPTFESSSVVGSSQPFWNLGGIWMSGANISTDGTNLYVVTGNGAFNGYSSNFDANGFPIDHDYGDTVLKLSPDTSTLTNQNGNGWGLKVSDYFTPSNQFELNDNDLDLGSGGATLMPSNVLDSAGNPMLMVGGKESRVYLIDRNNMGKFNYTYPTGVSSVDPSTYDRVVAEYANNGLNTGGKQIYSSAAYYNGNVYLGVNGSPALELNIASMVAGTTVASHSTYSFGYPGETFEISSNGNSSGVAWALNPGNSNLVAFNASSFTSTIYDSTTNAADGLGGTIHFHVPTVANGTVYAGSRGGGLGFYRLDLSYLNSNAAYFSAPSGLLAQQVSGSDVHLSWTSNSSLANEFRIDRSLDGSNWTTIAYTENSVTSYDDTTIAPSTRYQYRVVGISGVNLTSFSGIVTFTPTLLLSGPNLYLKLDSNGTSLDVWTNSSANGGVSQAVVLSQIAGATIVGTVANENVTVDFSNGNPLPVSGLSFNGAGGINTLTVIGDAGNDSMTVNASSIAFNGSFGSTTLSYSNLATISFSGGAGSDVLTQASSPGNGAQLLFQNTTSADTLNVQAGAMTLPMPTSGAAVPVAQLGSINISSGASLALTAPTGIAERALLVLGSLSLGGTAGNWQSKIDLAGNDLVIHSGSIGTLRTQIFQGTFGNGMGVVDSAAASDSRSLTTLGAIQNQDSTGFLVYGSSTTLGLFDNLPGTVSTDLLVRNTTYGDANLDGLVDGSDYTKIDNGFNNHLTGWLNGDFNDDNTIDGSDYTLIDNAFNIQSVGAATRVAFNSASFTITAGSTSSTITIQLRDSQGNPTKAKSGGQTISLTSSSSGGSFYSGSTAITAITIPTGASTASFTYKDTLSGVPTLTAAGTGLTSAMLQAMVTAGTAASGLAFSTTPLTQAVGTTSGLITVLLEDTAGDAVNAGTGGVTVDLASSGSNGIFKSTANVTISSVTIAAGSSSASFKYTDTTAGAPVISASASGVASALQQELLTATLSSVAFTSAAHTLISGAGPATVTVTLQDQVGNPISAGAGGVAVTLSSTSSGGTFYNSSNTVITSVLIPAGSSSVSVAYRDTSIGTPTLHAAVTGLATASQQQTVSALPTGTAAYYSFGSSAGLLTDTSGSGNTLKVGAGTVAFTGAGLPAGFTGAASFSNSGYLTTASGNFPTSVPTGASSYTIAAWIDINNSNKNGIVGWGNFGTNGTVNAFRTTSGDAAPNGAGLDNYWWANDQVQSTINLVNNWAYVAVTYDGTMRSMYVDGVLVGTYTNGVPNAAATNFRIGDTNGSEYFNGSMADLLISNTAFSSTQIDALYNGT